MTTVVVVVVVAGLAVVAIERSIAAGRMRSSRDVARLRAEGYRRASANIKRDAQRMQAAHAAALEAAEAAISAGDPRRAIAELARMQEEAARDLSLRDTDALLADEVATATSERAGQNGVRPFGGLLGRLTGGASGSVDGLSDDVDDAG